MQIIVFEYSRILMTTLENKRKIMDNLRGCTYNITHMPVANSPRLPNLVVIIIIIDQRVKSVYKKQRWYKHHHRSQGRNGW